MSSSTHASTTPEVVGFLIDRWDEGRGGGERVLADLARHLIAGGRRVIACAAEHAAGMPGESVVVKPRGLLRVSRERYLARALPEAAARAGCQVTIGARHLERVDLYRPAAGSVRVMLAQERRARGKDPDAPIRGRHKLFLQLERGLMQGGARWIACNSRLVRDELAREYPGAVERLVLIENGVDLERFHPRRRDVEGRALRAELRVAPGTALVAFAARHPELKGLPELLDALGELRGLPWKLAITGARHPERVRRWVRNSELDPRTHVFDDVDPASLFAAADLVAHPTWRDTSGLVILEALASGAAVVTTRLAGAAEILGPHTGSVVEAPDCRSELIAALATWVERAASAAIDPARVRDSVRGRAPDLAWRSFEALLDQPSA